jgi:hypothetical protein
MRLENAHFILFQNINFPKLHIQPRGKQCFSVYGHCSVLVIFDKWKHVCTGLEDKASACEMLVCYARELKEGFADDAEEVVKLMVPMLKFYFHDGVRTAAAESLPYLLDCAKIKGLTFLICCLVEC